MDITSWPRGLSGGRFPTTALVLVSMSSGLTWVNMDLGWEDMDLVWVAMDQDLAPESEWIKKRMMKI